MSSLHRLRMHTKQEFQTWLVLAEDRREELEEFLGLELDVEFDSLDVLEAALLKRYRTVEAALTLTERAVVEAASCHVGLVMVLSIQGAKWTINLDDERMAYYRLPIIRVAGGSEECPLSLVTASLDRRDGSFIKGVVMGYAEREAPRRTPKQGARGGKPKPKSRPKPKPKRARARR